MALLRIAIPFYDRVWLLKHCLLTLAKMTGREQVDFVVYLDGGFEQGALRVISEVLPEARTIESPVRLGSSGAVHRMLADYAENPTAERLLVIDADMIVRTDLVKTVLSWPVRTDMIISVYNSVAHQPIVPSPAPFLHKRRLGATGTLWSRDIARLVVDSLPAQGSYDDAFSDFCVSRNIPMCCTNLSLAQHLGVSGTNNRRFGYIDYGLNYTPDGPEQMEAMAQVFNDMMVEQLSFLGGK